MSGAARKTAVGVALVVLGVVAGVIAGRTWLAPGHAAEGEADKAAGDHEEKKPEAAALVRTAPVVEETVHPVIEALGSASVPTGAVAAVSWPSDVLVSRVLVQAGQTVEKGAPVAQVAMTRDGETQLALASQQAEAAARALAVAQERLDRALATRPEVIAAQGAADEAKQRLERLKAAVPPADGMVRAPGTGVVGSVKAQAGAVSAANTALVEINDPGAVVAQLGLEPAEAHDLRVGQRATVRPVDEHDAARYEGTVSIVSPALNPATRLIDVTVTLDGAARPAVGSMLRGELALPESKAVLVPRAGLVTGGDDLAVFVVRDGKAARVVVTLGRRVGERVEVTKGVAAGDRVVVVGQGQLEDGAPVREEHAGGEGEGKDGAEKHEKGGGGADR